MNLCEFYQNIIKQLKELHKIERGLKHTDKYNDKEYRNL